MPKVIENKKYMCNICSKVYIDVDSARSCESNHDIVLVPFERADLKRLVAFLTTGEARLLTPTLINLLIKYAGLKPE